MSALANPPDLTLARAAEMMAAAMRDKTFLELPMGKEVGRYLRAKRKELTASSYVGYESCLHKLALQFAYLELKDLEVPVGSERIEEWMDQRWGDSSPGTYNVNHSILSDFFRWQMRHQRMRSNPMELVGRARRRGVQRNTFSEDQCRAILASNADPHDRLCLQLLLFYGLRKGSLRAVQIKHFDFGRRRLTYFGKGGTVKPLPIPDRHFWYELEQLVEPIGTLKSGDFLLHTRRPVPRAGIYATPHKAMSNTPAHEWFRACLKRAGIESDGPRTAHMHMARHTAGQRVLDKTGNLKAVQKLLGHASIQTTGDVYADWDVDQLAQTLADVLGEDSDRPED
jgi:integrase